MHTHKTENVNMPELARRLFYIHCPWSVLIISNNNVPITDNRQASFTQEVLC